MLIDRTYKKSREEDEIEAASLWKEITKIRIKVEGLRDELEILKAYLRTTTNTK